MDSFKILFVDIDGTVLTSKKEIQSSTIYAFEELGKMGVEVVICSGRQRSFARRIAEISNAGRYVISCNGAEIYDRLEDKVIYSEIFPVDLLMKVKKMANKNHLRYRLVCGNTGYVNRDIRNLLDETLIDEENINEEFFREHIIPQVVISSNKYEDLDEVKEEIEKMNKIKIADQNKKSPDKNYYYLDITSKNTSKGNALNILCKYLNIERNYSVAIGDSENDIEMLQNSGVGIAMGNASIICMENADTITTTNDNNGIYNACLNLFDIMEMSE